MTKVLTVLLVLALCAAGGTMKTVPVQEVVTVDVNGENAQGDDLDQYLASVREEADAISASLETDDLTQTEMNLKAGELSDLWDTAMNRTLEAVMNTLSAEEMEELTADQNEWLETRTQAMEAAGKEFEGGSMYALVVNSEAAALTEARVLELYEKLK